MHLVAIHLANRLQLYIFPSFKTKSCNKDGLHNIVCRTCLHHIHAKIVFSLLVLLLYFPPQFQQYKTKIKVLMPVKIGIDSDVLQTDVRDIWRQSPPNRQ